MTDNDATTTDATDDGHADYRQQLRVLADRLFNNKPDPATTVEPRTPHIVQSEGGNPAAALSDHQIAQEYVKRLFHSPDADYQTDLDSLSRNASNDSSE